MSLAVRTLMAVARGVHFRGKLRLLDALGVGPSNRDLVPPEVQAVECIEGIVMATEQNRDVMFRRFYTDGLTDDEVFVALANLLSPGQVFWDVGANYGFMAIYVDRHFRGAVRSVAFEPSPTVLKELRRNVDINRCKSVAVEPTCLTDRVGPLTFFVSEDHSWNATLVASMAAASGQDRAIEVEGSTIDEMVTRLPPPDVLKIDVEGAEHLVVEGGN